MARAPRPARDAGPLRSGGPTSVAGLAPAGTSKRARGNPENPPSRFERLHYVEDLETREQDRIEAGDEPAPAHPTLYFRDPSKTAISTNDSPDIGFDASLNPYRGCLHGCAYCYARPTHETLGLSAGLDFESRILVKPELPKLLRKELLAPQWRPQVIAMSGVTDAYQPIERQLRITRDCLGVLAELRNPVSIVTKNALITRDTDLLSRLAEFSAASANVSITTLDRSLARSLEPRASQPEQRLRAVTALAQAGVPVGVIVAPVIPGLNDHEIPAILSAARDAGARFAGMILLRLPHGTRELFAAWLARHRPERAERVLARVREARGGQLNDPRFGSRMRGEGRYAAQLRDLFALQRRRLGLAAASPELSTKHFRTPGGSQLGLFDSP